MTGKPEQPRKAGTNDVRPQGTITLPKHSQNKFFSRRCGLNSQRGDRNSSEFAVVRLSFKIAIPLSKELIKEDGTSAAGDTYISVFKKGGGNLNSRGTKNVFLENGAIALI